MPIVNAADLDHEQLQGDGKGMSSTENINGSSNCTRTLTEINSILEFAKFSPSDFKTHVQCVSYSKELDNDAVKLMELEEPVLDALMAGEAVTIRGDTSDNAVLVTGNLTYDMKEAETSNSMLLLSDLSYGEDLPDEGPQKVILKEVCSVIHNYFELRHIKPRLKKMREMLEENVFRGKECEGDEHDVGPKFTLAQLRNCVQASDQEITTGLTKLGACEIDGYWRLLDFEYQTTVLHHIIHLCEERDWLVSGIQLEECCQVLEDLFPRKIIVHVLSCHSKDRAAEGGMDIDEKNNLFLCEDKVCKHFAELCLRNTGKFHLKDFLKTWQESVPDGMITSLPQIEGMALIDRDSRPEFIWYYNVDDLSEEVSTRFEELFQARQKWSLEEITPYVRDLTTEKIDVGALLTKFARASLQGGIKVFSSRKKV